MFKVYPHFARRDKHTKKGTESSPPPRLIWPHSNNIPRHLQNHLISQIIMACIKRLNITTSEEQAPTFVLQPQRDAFGIKRIYSANTVGCSQI